VSVIAFDLGASNGKTLVGHFDGEKLTYEEIYRFSNDPVQVGKHLHWDILRLYWEVEQGLIKAKNSVGRSIKSLGIDTWAVDFGLLDKNGELLGNPYHYRDHQNDGIIDKVFEVIGPDELYQKTGIQFMPINTIYQLFALKSRNAQVLEAAQDFLMIPDLLRYFLTGEKVGEQTNASTTQLVDALSRKWDYSIIKLLHLPDHIFPETVSPGTYVGNLRSSVSERIGLSGLPVYTVGEHDTASAVAAVPSLNKHFAYLSCGTWSLLGTELDQPILNKQARDWNFTNEYGVNHTFRLLKNIMGLWLLQECMRVWKREGEGITFDQMHHLVKAAKPFKCFIDPDEVRFLNPAHMPEQIRQYCRETRQSVPETKGEIIRTILESLALKYRYVLERTERLTGKHFDCLHMVGGGINNTILCQFTANAIKRPVVAGPTEATAIGNILVQYIALGEIKDMTEGRKIIRSSFSVKEYEPIDASLWEESYDRFIQFIK
jgi:rhamnulokinase